MEEILHQLIGGFPFIHTVAFNPRWCRISSISSMGEKVARFVSFIWICHFLKSEQIRKPEYVPSDKLTQSKADMDHGP